MLKWNLDTIYSILQNKGAEISGAGRVLSWFNSPRGWADCSVNKPPVLGGWNRIDPVSASWLYTNSSRAACKIRTGVQQLPHCTINTHLPAKATHPPPFLAHPPPLHQAHRLTCVNIEFLCNCCAVHHFNMCPMEFHTVLTSYSQQPKT